MRNGELVAEAVYTKRNNILVTYLDKHEVKKQLWLTKKNEWMEEE